MKFTLLLSDDADNLKLILHIERPHIYCIYNLKYIQLQVDVQWVGSQMSRA